MPRILVVDDEPLVRGMIRDYLETQGLAVVEAENGEEALMKIHQGVPDLILLDIMMPKLDGLQVCRALKADPATEAIPVVLLTARDSLEDRVRGLQAGANDYLIKPVEPTELLARIQAHLRAKQLYDALEQRQRDLASLLELSQAVSSTLRPSEIFHLIVERTAQLVEARRCSLLVLGDEEIGYVIASQDNPRITRLPIRLDRYPEIREAIRRR